MPDNSQPDFRTTELDPDLLSTPFEVESNWHVITGAPSCGKTTLINLLAEKGFKTVLEGARQYMEREIAKGRSVDDVHANVVALQRGIRNMQIEIELGLQATDFIFLDRAIPDCLAWHRLFGLNPNEFLLECFRHRYASVFILDPLPLQLDGLRFKDDTYASFLDECHTRDYSALGYSVVRVPVLPPEERVSFILETLTEQGFL
jgi:predicted ATPase